MTQFDYGVDGSELPSLPISNYDDMKTLEEILLREEQEIILLNLLKRIGGVKVTTTINAILSCSISTQISLDYSLRGKFLTKILC